MGSVVQSLAVTAAGVVVLLGLGTAGVCAQDRVAGQAVTLPLVQVGDLGFSNGIGATFAKPPGSQGKVPVVVILHGSNGVDGRGAFYARALLEAGIGVLEVEMFPQGGRPSGTRAGLPHAAAALKWLKTQPDVEADRLGVMGFSFGGGMVVRLRSEGVQQTFGDEVARPIAFAAMYPVCSALARPWTEPRPDPTPQWKERMGNEPLLIQVGTLDDYEIGDRPCDVLAAQWPAEARERLTIRYISRATHAFDEPRRSRNFYDEGARGGRGGNVRVTPDRGEAAEARKVVVAFFLEHLTR